MLSRDFFRRFFSYAALILFTIIAIYPILQVVTISLRPADRLLSTSLEIITDNATLRNYY